MFIAIAGLSLLVGWGIDNLDSELEIKDKVRDFLREAFPDLTVKNILDKEMDENTRKLDDYIGSDAMNGSGFFGF